MTNPTLEQVRTELAEWVTGARSWSDQHHGLPDEIELTARADEATIRLLIARLAASAALVAAAAVTPSEPTLCAECNEIKVLGLPEDKVLCMDCAYEYGRRRPYPTTTGQTAGSELARVLGRMAGGE